MQHASAPTAPTALPPALPPMRRVPFADLSIGQLFIVHDTVHIKKSQTAATNCANFSHLRMSAQTIVEIA